MLEYAFVSVCVFVLDCVYGYGCVAGVSGSPHFFQPRKAIVTEREIVRNRQTERVSVRERTSSNFVPPQNIPQLSRSLCTEVMPEVSLEVVLATVS